MCVEWTCLRTSHCTCCRLWTVEAILRPVEASGGIPIHFGEFSYVNFLHLYRLSFSSLTFTKFFSFLFSLFFSFLSFYWNICLYTVRLISSWIGWLIGWNVFPTLIYTAFCTQCVWNGPAWRPATVRVADSGQWKPYCDLLKPVVGSHSTLESPVM